jgi:Skp family chaperone for outer membrane proteins
MSNTNFNKSNFVHNKIFTNTNNIKTKLCNNIKEKGICPFGDKCRFAHTQEEIRKAPCAFQKNCKNPSCPYSHEATEELDKIIDKVENTLNKLSLIEKESKDLIIHLEEETVDEKVEKEVENENKMEEDIIYETSYYENVASKINSEEENVYNYMKTYDQEIKIINNYKLDVTMDEYSFKKLVFYLNSTNTKFTYEKL